MERIWGSSIGDFVLIFICVAIFLLQALFSHLCYFAYLHIPQPGLDPSGFEAKYHTTEPRRTW